MDKEFKKVILIGIAVLFTGLAMLCFAEPHWNNQTTLMSQDDGDSIRPFSVSVGTTTPVLVYYSTQTAAPARNGYPSVDRVVGIENIQPFDLFCSTTNTMSATSGARWQIFSTTYTNVSGIWQTYSAPKNIYCLFGPNAGAGTREILGWVGYDSGD